jgi:hypothetical protein
LWLATRDDLASGRVPLNLKVKVVDKIRKIGIENRRNGLDPLGIVRIPAQIGLQLLVASVKAVRVHRPKPSPHRTARDHISLPSSVRKCSSSFMESPEVDVHGLVRIERLRFGNRNIPKRRLVQRAKVGQVARVALARFSAQRMPP